MSEKGMQDTHGELGTPWVGFDLDGTLAEYDHWVNYCHIGKPIEPMVKYIRYLHERGTLVKIVTARVAPKATDNSKPGGGTQEECREVIRKWCQKYLGFTPEVTHEKDHLMIELYDDRVKQVIRNKGIVLEEQLHRVLHENERLEMRNAELEGEVESLKRQIAYSKPVVTKAELLSKLNELARSVGLSKYGDAEADYFDEDDISEDNGLSFVVSFFALGSRLDVERIYKLRELANRQYGVSYSESKMSELKFRKPNREGAEVCADCEWHFSPNYVKDETEEG